ncbi:MAG: ABC transporter substrate-binding protein [Dehalococcoidia bacterium]
MRGYSEDYWTRVMRRRYARRTILRGAALAGAGLAGALALACGGDGSESSSDSGQAAATGTGPAQANQADSLGGLIGRTGKDPTSETPVRGGTYVATLSGNPPTLDPQSTVSINTGTPSSAAMSRLFRFKTFWEVGAANNKEIEPDLAQSAESPDGLTWTFKLRPDAKFHNVAPVNGHAVEAADVKATFVRAVAPSTANRGSLLMVDPAKIETPDSSTVVFKLNYPYAPFPKLLASAIFSWVFPREGVEGVYDPATKMIGSGPFILESYTPDVALNFKRNPDWFEKDRPYVDGVKLAIVPDPAQRLAQFTAGNTDAVAVLQEDVPAMTSQNPKAEVIQNIGNGNGIMYYQLSEPNSIFQDMRIRQAASLAADRASYGKVYFGEKYIRTFNVTPDFGKWVITWDELPQETKQWYEFDLQRARQLMDAAGGSSLSIKLAYPVGNPAEPLLKNTGETILSMLKALPWNISYVPIDYIKDWQGGGKGYGFGGMPGDSMSWWGLAIRNDVDEFLYGFWHSKSTGNISRLNDPHLDAMIDKGRAILDEEERLRAYKEVQKHLLDNVYSLAGMVNGVGYTLVQERVRNYTLGDTWGPAANLWGKVWLTP